MYACTYLKGLACVAFQLDTVTKNLAGVHYGHVPSNFLFSGEKS